ncbi:hypothetical protein FRB90_004853, partial [Tulasnella sp. 427]
SSSKMTIIVHYLVNSRAQRVLWLLEELEVPYEVKRYERVNLLAPPELRKVHPLGVSPVITDGDVTVAESGAIVEYLITKYGKGKLQPPESGWLDNLYCEFLCSKVAAKSRDNIELPLSTSSDLHYAEGTLMPLLVWKLILTVTPNKVPFLIRPVARGVCNTLIARMIDVRLVDNMDLIEEQLKKHPGGWFAGGSEPTAADFMMLFPMEVFAKRSPKPTPESFNAYVNMIHDRPAYKRALEKGGSYAYAKL